MSIENAYDLLQRSIVYFHGEPLGTAASCDTAPSSNNYQECFVRDFVPVALVFLIQGSPAIVRNFLTTVMKLRGRRPILEAHVCSSGLMPASFRVQIDNGEEVLVPDFGERAIGRVVPVDSAMWWLFLLRAYVIATEDWELVTDKELQACIRQILDLYLSDRFECTPTLLVPDGSFMIDRRMGVYGYPLEIQALYYSTLFTAHELLQHTGAEESLLSTLEIRTEALRAYVQHHYWIDRDRLNEIYRYKTEQYGLNVANILNIYPESIPDWMDGWLDLRSGYLVGNQGPGQVDFRFFAQGNLLAILFGLATEEEASGIMNLYELHWDELIGEIPAKICYPAASGEQWLFLTGGDPKNMAWSYHNGGNWPVLIWPFVGAAKYAGRQDLAQRALELLTARIEHDNWPEYYDGKQGGLIGRRANLYQTWSAAGFIVAQEIMRSPEYCNFFECVTFKHSLKDALKIKHATENSRNKYE